MGDQGRRRHLLTALAAVPVDTQVTGVMVQITAPLIPVAVCGVLPVLVVAAAAAHPDKLATLMVVVAVAWGCLVKALTAQLVAAAVLAAYREHLQTEMAAISAAVLVVMLPVLQPQVVARFGLFGPVIRAHSPRPMLVSHNLLELK